MNPNLLNTACIVAFFCISVFTLIATLVLIDRWIQQKKRRARREREKQLDSKEEMAALLVKTVGLLEEITQQNREMGDKIMAIPDAEELNDQCVRLIKEISLRRG